MIAMKNSDIEFSFDDSGDGSGKKETQGLFGGLSRNLKTYSPGHINSFKESEVGIKEIRNEIIDTLEKLEKDVKGKYKKVMGQELLSVRSMDNTTPFFPLKFMRYQKDVEKDHITWYSDASGNKPIWNWKVGGDPKDYKSYLNSSITCGLSSIWGKPLNILIAGNDLTQDTAVPVKVDNKSGRLVDPSETASDSCRVHVVVFYKAILQNLRDFIEQLDQLLDQLYMKLLKIVNSMKSIHATMENCKEIIIAGQQGSDNVILQRGETLVIARQQLPKKLSIASRFLQLFSSSREEDLQSDLQSLVLEITYSPAMGKVTYKTADHRSHQLEELASPENQPYMDAFNLLLSIAQQGLQQAMESKVRLNVQKNGSGFSLKKGTN
jgi:hypothetical protein